MRRSGHERGRDPGGVPDLEGGRDQGCGRVRGRARPGGGPEPPASGFMRLKLDENLPRRVERFLEDAGHDCTTVVEEGLGGAIDSRVVAAAAGEGRMLATLDRGFGD